LSEVYDHESVMRNEMKGMNARLEYIGEILYYIAEQFVIKELTNVPPPSPAEAAGVMESKRRILKILESMKPFWMD